MICGVKLSVVLFLNIENRVKKGRVVMGFENLPIPLKNCLRFVYFPLLTSFDSFLLCFSDKVTTESYSFMSLIVKIVSLGLAFVSLAPGLDKIQRFFHLSFNSHLQLISGISSDLQKLLAYFNDIAIDVFVMIPFTPSPSVFRNNLALYSKDLKPLLFAMSALKLVASSLEQNHKLPVMSG